MVLGLGGGLVLSAPLSALISKGSLGESTAALNPFAGWSQGLSQQDLLLLGTDVEGGNTDVIATLRVDGGISRVTQIPRDTYIEAEGYGPLKINASMPSVVPTPSNVKLPITWVGPSPTI